MRPLLYFDTETTGTNVAKDRIIELGVCVDDPALPENGPRSHLFRFNPGVPIPDEAIDVHGITNTAVQNCPPFSKLASQIYALFKGHNLAGYNILNFDVPILWEEFHRAGIVWDLTGIHIVDACKIFRIKEERTLEYAMRFYCGVDHDNAHSALGDVLATRQVLEKQLERYEGLGAMTVDELSAYCGTHERVDLAGKVVRNKDWVPVYAFGKSKDVPVVRDRNYAEWMLRSDFSEQTKMILRGILSGKIK